MTIASTDDFIASAKQSVSLGITTSRTTVAATPFSLAGIVGFNGVEVLAGASTTTGVTQTSSTVGFPTIQPFGIGAKGYIASIACSAPNPGRYMLYDCLWKGGAYAFNANTSGNVPTSYASRIIDNNYSDGLELWYEQVTGGTGIPSVNVSYLDQDGNAASTGVISLGAAHIQGRMTRLPLANGDSGLQGVTGVVASVATVGTFNLLVMRKLWEGRINTVNQAVVDGIDTLGLPEIFATSALRLIVATDATIVQACGATVKIVSK